MARTPGGRRPPRTPRISLASMLAIAAVVLGACGGAAVAPSPSPSAVAKATLPPATSAAATAKPSASAQPTAAPAATTVNLEAGENADGGIYMKADQAAVNAGGVTFKFTNKGKLTHEFMVYPVQDITALLATHRAGKEVDEMDLLKGMAAMKEDVDPGDSATVTGTLKAGFYEIACHVTGQNPDGSTFVHFDKGQFITLAAIGAGGPAASVATASSAVKVEMKETDAGWLFTPDHLVLSAGKVSFAVTNNATAEHDFVISPQGDTTKYIKASLMPGMDMHNDDFSSFKGTELLEDLAPGKTQTVTFDVTPGYWVVACYMMSKNADGTSFFHRDKGQRIVFLVK